MGEGQGEESKWGRKGKCGPTVISLGEKEREKGKQRDNSRKTECSSSVKHFISVFYILPTSKSTVSTLISLPSNFL